MNNNPKSRQSNLVIQELKNEILIYDLDTNKAYCLNETSAAVWQMCDGENSVLVISKLLSRKLNNSVSEDCVWLALDQLKQENLLEEKENLKINFGGLNRRQMIRKVGLTTVVMLPVISSLVAPTAIMAQSAGSPGILPLFSPCSSALQCASRACNGVCCLGNSSKTSCSPATGCADSECCSGASIGNVFGCASPFSCLCT